MGELMQIECILVASFLICCESCLLEIVGNPLLVDAVA